MKKIKLMYLRKDYKLRRKLKPIKYMTHRNSPKVSIA